MLVQVKERRQRFDEDPVEHEANKNRSLIDLVSCILQKGFAKKKTRKWFFLTKKNDQKRGGMFSFCVITISCEWKIEQMPRFIIYIEGMQILYCLRDISNTYWVNRVAPIRRQERIDRFCQFLQKSMVAEVSQAGQIFEEHERMG